MSVAMGPDCGKSSVNLMGNAVKFTEKGFVHFKVAKGDGENSVDFEVEDSGPGIPKAHLGRLFQEFSQAGIESQRRFGCSGLGLVISRQIVTLMGGDIGVDSVENQGSRFLLHDKNGSRRGAGADVADFNGFDRDLPRSRSARGGQRHQPKSSASVSSNVWSPRPASFRMDRSSRSKR